MKYNKIIFINSLVILVLLYNPTYGQSKSKEALGNSIVESILNNDLNSFKSLLLPKKVVFNFQENIDIEISDKEVRDSLMTQYEATYDHMVIPRYEKNFQEIVNLNETNDLDWSDLNFMILYKASSKGEEYIPFFIHTKLNNSDYSHFYFSAVRYNGKWYLSGNMEITKDEKYAPK